MLRVVLAVLALATSVGAISAGQLRTVEMLHKRATGDHSEEPLANIISQFDTDPKDNMLSLDEFDHLYDELFAMADPHGHDDNHDNHDGHDDHGAATHAVRKEPTRVRELVARVETESKEEGARCHPMKEIFLEYDFDANGLLNQTEVAASTVRLLAMVTDKCKEKQESCKADDPTLAWVYGLLSTLLISTITLMVVVFFPVMHRERMQSIMVAFAVGALVGDGIIHLIPQALGVHSHGEAEAEETHNELGYLGPACMVLVGIVLFFILERQLVNFHHHRTIPAPNAPCSIDLLPEDEKNASSSTSSDVHSISDQESASDTDISKAANQETEDSSAPIVPWLHRYQPLAYMILLGDAAHNITDGLALGAAYATSTSAGVATTIAIFVHEVPQEVADFSILLKCGFPKWQAVVFNFLTGLTALLGTIIGVAVGQFLEGANKYVLALIAGSFIYIALNNMVSELMKQKGGIATLTQTSMMVFGFVAMICITLLEQLLHVDC